MTGRLIAGIGIRPGTEAADILACLDEALAIAGLAGAATPRFATLASRVAEAGMVAAAADRSAELVANVVTIEGEAKLAELYAAHGGSLRRISIDRLAPVGGKHGWRPAMAVTQWRVEKP